MSNHTPGPWKISMMNDGPIGITSSIGEWIAKIYPGSNAQGNVRLIAAAPELLQILEDILFKWECDEPQNAKVEYQAVTRQLINRVKGDGTQ